MKAFLLSAGYGTRMGELTRDCPKALLPLPSTGIPIIFYVLFQLFLCDIEAVIINLHYLGAKIRKALENFPHFPIYFLEEPIILGSAGGIRNGLEKYYTCDEILMICNVDTISYFANDQQRQKIIAQAQTECQQDGAHLFLAPMPKASNENHYTPFVFDEGSRVYTSKKHVSNKMFYYFIGLSLLQVSQLNHLPLGKVADLRNIWRNLECSNQLRATEFSGTTYDFGTNSQFHKLANIDPIPQYLKQDWKKFISWYNA